MTMKMMIIINAITSKVPKMKGIDRNADEFIAETGNDHIFKGLNKLIV